MIHQEAVFAVDTPTAVLPFFLPGRPPEQHSFFYEIIKTIARWKGQYSVFSYFVLVGGWFGVSWRFQLPHLFASWRYHRSSDAVWSPTALRSSALKQHWGPGWAAGLGTGLTQAVSGLTWAIPGTHGGKHLWEHTSSHWLPKFLVPKCRRTPAQQPDHGCSGALCWHFCQSSRFSVCVSHYCGTGSLEQITC